LKPSEVQSFYDRFGKKQDAQSFYEDPAVEDLLANARFAEAENVFEFGCGTGRLAARLLAGHLPASATYLGYDLSRTMVALARARLATYGGRARVLQSDGAMHFPLPDNSVDRVISTYVFDLLSGKDIGDFLREAYRVLDVRGKLCLVSLTKGTTFLSRVVSNVWGAIFRLRASLVGGCRPIRLEEHINSGYWELEYRKVVIAFGVPSEVLIAQAKDATRKGAAADAAKLRGWAQVNWFFKEDFNLKKEEIDTVKGAVKKTCGESLSAQTGAGISRASCCS
jgi:ubiquinone/menaquinone biosynthesis C-methylase UbiE